MFTAPTDWHFFWDTARVARLQLSPLAGNAQALLINFVRCSVLQRVNFKAKVRSAKWSPDGKWVIATWLLEAQPWCHSSWELCITPLGSTMTQNREASRFAVYRRWAR